MYSAGKKSAGRVCGWLGAELMGYMLSLLLIVVVFFVVIRTALKKPEPEPNKGVMEFPKNYIVLDLETTGLSAEYDHIIEFAAIRIVNDEIKDAFSTFIKPPGKIPPEATAVNKITDDIVKDAPRIKEVISNIADFIGSEIVIGYNTKFDIGFLNKAYTKHLKKDFYVKYIDLLPVAREKYPELKNHKLTTVAKHLGIETKGAHRAIEDVAITKRLIDAMFAE
jgi:DNA polymerase III epsilon subunit family exonuclease